MELLKIVHAAALGQGALILILLLTSFRSNIKANIFLSLLVMTMMHAIYVGYADLQGWNTERLNQLGIYPLFIHGPVIYAYSKMMTNRSTLDWRLIKHFLWILFPFIWVALELYKNQRGILFLQLTSFVQILCYYLLSIKVLKEYAESIKTNFANIDKYKLRWLYVLVIGLGVFICFDLGVSLTITLTGWDLAWLQGRHLLAIESTYVFLIGIFAAKQPQIIFAQPLVEKTRKYDRSSLNHQKAENLIEHISQLMLSEQLYLDNEISLSDLARKLEVSPSHLSQALNENLGKSFYDYINEMRINQTKVLLSDDKSLNKTILDIAFEVGFNNKTSFNRAFKKYTGMTPSQFKQKSSN